MEVAIVLATQPKIGLAIPMGAQWTVSGEGGQFGGHAQ